MRRMLQRDRRMSTESRSFIMQQLLGQNVGEEAVSSILRRCFIVRISWVFGINGKNFIRTMLRLGQSHAKLTVVDDQVGSPTYTRDLSVLLADMIQTERYGVYHATNEGFCSWAELAAEERRRRGPV